MNTLLDKIKRGNLSALKRYTNNTITKSNTYGKIPLKQLKQDIFIIEEHISRNEAEPAIVKYIKLLENYKRLKKINDENSLNLKMQIQSLCSSLLVYYMIKREHNKNV